MSDQLKNLRERRATLARETRHLCNEHTNDWNADTHGKTYDTNMAEIERIDASISRIVKAAEVDGDREFAAMGGRDTSLHARGARDAGDDLQNPRALARMFMRSGLEGVNAEQRAAILNVMSTGVGAEGGYTVASEVAAQLLDAVKEFGGMREAATVIRTSKGNPLSWPTSDATNEIGEQIAENGSSTDADTTFGTVGVPVHKFSSKVITVPFELLQDSELDIESIVNGRLGVRIARITNTKFTTGTGTNESRGILTASAVGKTGATGQTLTVTYDDLVDLQHSVDPAYRKLGAGFMLHDSSLKVIRKIKDSQGRPIFVPGYETGVPGGAPDELLGDAVIVNQDMPVMAANAKSILFGYLKGYVIRDALDVTLFRFADSVFARKGQVGFLAWARSGGNYTDVGASLRHYANSAT
jgi:HK97 family phage major capsid protein